MTLNKKNIEIMKYIMVEGYSSREGEYKKLPSERFICNKFSVSRVIVRNIYSFLIEKGIIRRSHGSGYYLKREELFLMASLKNELKSKKVILKDEISKDELMFLKTFGWNKGECSIKKTFLGNNGKTVGVLFSSLWAPEFKNGESKYPKEDTINNLARIGYVPFRFTKKRVAILTNDSWIVKNSGIEIAEIWVTKQYDEDNKLYEHSIAIIDSNHINPEFNLSVLN